MTGSNLFLLLFLISPIDLVNHVSALVGEGILGGIPAERHKFTYQVAILGKKNYSDVAHLIGSGGIIAHNLILTAAQCFIHQNGSLRKFMFFIIVDEINLNNRPKIEIDIDKFFFPHDVNLINKDISVAKLTKSLEYITNPHWSKLFIPFAAEHFFDERGIVTGYGFSSIALACSNSGYQYRFSGFAENKLKYAEALVIHSRLCKHSYSNYNNETQMCAVMLTNNLKQPWGICEKDIGSPLVINNKIAAVASRNRPSCHDSEYGCIYTKISAFAFFVDYTIDGNPPTNTLIYRNRRHIPPSTCSLWNCITNPWKIVMKKVLLVQDEEERAGVTEPISGNSLASKNC